jgi:hypothetical protein
MEREWIKVKELGQLYVEKVLVTFDVPILFVCVDYENRKYLCLNDSEDNDKYVVAETDNTQLIDMLRNKITMESVFRKSVDGKVIIAEYDYENENIITRVESATQVSKDLLPEEGAFFELNNKMILDYIVFLEKQIIRIDVVNFCDEMSFKPLRCGYNVYFSVSATVTFSSEKIKAVNTKDNCLYDVYNNRMMA